MTIYLPECLIIAKQAVANGAIQKSSELATLLAMLSVARAKTIIEIGVWSGGTLYAWQQIADTVIGIDNVPAGAKDRPKRNTHGAMVIIGDSHQYSTADRLDAPLAGRLADMLFIDADHTYNAVKADYEMYAPLVKPGGLVVFHDIVSPDCQVDQLWDEIKDDTAVEIIAPGPEPGIDWLGANWGGLGVLTKSHVVV